MNNLTKYVKEDITPTLEEMFYKSIDRSVEEKVRILKDEVYKVINDQNKSNEPKNENYLNKRKRIFLGHDSNN